MNIYISNLDSIIGNEQLRQLFMPFGQVTSAEIMRDVASGESRGFGYVHMEDDMEAQQAIKQLNETEQEALTILVQENK